MILYIFNGFAVLKRAKESPPSARFLQRLASTLDIPVGCGWKVCKSGFAPDRLGSGGSKGTQGARMGNLSLINVSASLRCSNSSLSSSELLRLTSRRAGWQSPCTCVQSFGATLSVDAFPTTWGGYPWSAKTMNRPVGACKDGVDHQHEMIEAKLFMWGQCGAAAIHWSCFSMFHCRGLLDSGHRRGGVKWKEGWFEKYALVTGSQIIWPSLALSLMSSLEMFLNSGMLCFYIFAVVEPFSFYWTTFATDTDSGMWDTYQLVVMQTYPSLKIARATEAGYLLCFQIVGYSYDSATTTCVGIHRPTTGFGVGFTEDDYFIHLSVFPSPSPVANVAMPV